MYKSTLHITSKEVDFASHLYYTKISQVTSCKTEVFNADGLSLH